MKRQIFILLLLISASAYGQSFSCSPEHVTLASHTSSGPYVEPTTTNWKRIDYHILGEKAVSMTYKHPDDPLTKINPLQREEHVVLEASPEKVILLAATAAAAFSFTVDVIFPKDGNGYTFNVSDYPKFIPNHNLNNLSKLYVLKCRELQ